MSFIVLDWLGLTTIRLTNRSKNLRVRFWCKLIAFLLTYTDHLSLFEIDKLACAEEVKGIEFTVTTLNCTQDQTATTPEHRRKFSSLRKTGALSKAVRSKISKSFYNNSSSNKHKNDKAVITVTALEDEKNSGMNATTNADTIEKSKQQTTCNTKSTAALTATTTTTATTITKAEKHKKRSKLCQLLWPKFCG